MEFLVEFEVEVPDGTPESEVIDRRTGAESMAAAELAAEGHLLRVFYGSERLSQTTRRSSASTAPPARPSSTIY